MKLNLKRSLLAVFATSFLISCAHQVSPVEKISQFKFDPEKALNIQGEYTQELVDSAVKSGPEAKKYLSSELFFKGMDASMRGELATSLHFLKFAFDLNPNDHYLLRKYAIELVKAGELNQALSLLESNVNVNSSLKDDGAALLLAGVYATLDKGEAAKKIYEKLISESEQFQEACLFLARYYGTEKKFAEAHRALDRCMKRDANEPLYGFYKGRLYQDAGKRDLALKAYQQTLKLDPDFFQATLAIGSIHEEKEDFKSALNEYKKYVENIESTNVHPVLSRMVQVMFSLEMNTEAMPYAERLVSLDDNDLTTKVRLGLLYVDSDQYAKAITLFNEVLSVVPESDKVLYYLAALYQETKQNELALQYFSKIQDSSPLFQDSLLQRGEIMSEVARARFKSNKEISQELISFVDAYSVKYDELKVELGLIKASYFDEISEFERSVETLKSLKGHKKFTDGHEYYLASVLEKKGNKDEARSIVAGLIKKDPNNAHALNFLGYSYLESNENMDLAYTYISRALKLRPEDGYIRDSMAWYYYKVGKFDQALNEAMKAYELVNNDVTITKHLGMIYEKLNKFDRARAFYDRALTQIDQTSSEREELLKSIQNIDQKRKPASLP